MYVKEKPKVLCSVHCWTLEVIQHGLEELVSLRKELAPKRNNLLPLKNCPCLKKRLVNPEANAIPLKSSPL